MQNNDLITFISAGMLKPKKRDHILARRQQYLNYGALSLATSLKIDGYSVKLRDGAHTNPEIFLKHLIASGTFNSKHPLLLSIPSLYALSWSQEFTKLVKHHDTNIRIIVGGRWVVGSDTNWIASKLPYVDSIIPGLAEHKIEHIVTGKTGHKSTARTPNGTPSFNLDHTLMSNFSDYQPSIEISRGCGMGCNFCEERDIPLSRMKDPEFVALHLTDIIKQYGDTNINPYFQASFFAPNSKWADRLANATNNLGIDTQWRCETRVDAIKPETIATLAETGLKAIDLGLETASEIQILKMNKSNNPERYLQSASDLLSACKKKQCMGKT